MGGWKSFHNSGILSSIRYRQLLEEKGLNGEPVQVSLVDNPIKMKKNNEFVYFLCRFCGHQQKIDVGDDVLREDYFRHLKEKTIPNFLDFNFQLSKKRTARGRVVSSLKYPLAEGEKTIEINDTLCTECLTRWYNQLESGKWNEVKKCESNTQRTGYSPLGCCSRVLCCTSSDLSNITGSRISETHFETLAKALERERSRTGLSHHIPESEDNILGAEEITLKEAPWFQAGISREIALEILGRQRIGSFLIRHSSSKPGCYALTLRVPNEFRPKGIANYLILQTNRGFKIKGFTKEFTTITSLVIHHSVMPELLPCPLILNGGPRYQLNSNDFVDITCPDHGFESIDS